MSTSRTSDAAPPSPIRTRAATARVVARPPLESGQAAERMAETGHQGPKRGAVVAQRRQEGRRTPPRARVGRPHLREHRRRMDRRRHRRSHRAPQGPWKALHRVDNPRPPAVLSQLPSTGARADARRWDWRGRVADVGRLPEPRRPFSVSHHDTRGGWLGDLRMGDRAQPPARGPAIPFASSSCRRTTRSRGSASPLLPKPNSCSRRSRRRTPSPTPLRSTRASAAPRSTASNGPRCSDGKRIGARPLVTRAKSEAPEGSSRRRSCRGSSPLEPPTLGRRRGSIGSRFTSAVTRTPRR